MGSLRIIDASPPPETFAEWRAQEGWGRITAVQASRAIGASLICALALEDDVPVGFGRVVGDGVLYFYIQDLIVPAAHQGRGIGTRILRDLLDRIGAMAPGDAFVGLMSADGREGFYKRFGFQVRPGKGMGAGMGLDLSCGERSISARRPTD